MVLIIIVLPAIYSSFRHLLQAALAWLIATFYALASPLSSTTKLFVGTRWMRVNLGEYLLNNWSMACEVSGAYPADEGPSTLLFLKALYIAVLYSLIPPL